ncbi:MAG: tRNA-guanine transglycosylase DpdA [Acidobacteriota bacterium]
MTKQLLVLGCSQVKRNATGLLPAIDRYDGTAYRVLRKFLRSHCWPGGLSVAVLSAKYGLVGGFTGIEDYDERMTPNKAAALSGRCHELLYTWSQSHRSIHFSLGKDYLPAVKSALDSGLESETEVFDGPIGMKLSQIKDFLSKTISTEKHKADLPEPGSGQVSYFLPDWDDLLDINFNFSTDTFSGKSPSERGDKHCSILMKPERMHDGILVSLAQHVTSKGPLRRFEGSEEQSLAPKNLRDQFGLEHNQTLFGDCGAFSYVNEVEPSISVEQAVALYDLHGFDFGASVDHIPVAHVFRKGLSVDLTRGEQLARVRKTKKNAELFLDAAHKRRVSFRPVGTIQALDPASYAQTVKLYYEFGYRYIAIGGLVPQSDAAIQKIVKAVMKTVSKLPERPWIHLFGVFRPKLQELFRNLKVDSFDSATYFRKAWLRSDQNYLATDGNWYAAIRVPMTKDPRTRKRLEESKVDLQRLEIQEATVMNLLTRYGREEISMREVLDAVIGYDEQLTRSSEVQSLQAKYKKTLGDRPWKSCACPFCKDIGIHMLIFRGANRNKRRGTHNTLMLYNMLRTDAIPPDDQIK